jgi:hypothetical protein
MEEMMFSSKLVPQSPRQFELVQIKAQLASELNLEWHSRLPIIHWSNIVRNKHYACYGAMFDWQYFAVGIWSSPVSRSFDDKSVLELRRLAISDACPKFTATWMIGKMVKDITKNIPEIDRLISYQDMDVHTGTIYKAANWKMTYAKKYTGGWDKSRIRLASQSTANKARWEYEIRR